MTASRIEREIDFTVSDLTKVIDGVQTRVAWERDYSDGEMEEVELTYYAQDDSGTVWYFGEYSEELDNGKIDDSPSLAGWPAEGAAGHHHAGPARHGHQGLRRGLGSGGGLE